MAKFEFEEYRQLWETGPHWELKREFMEKYQNDYPLDRLLCLAQAYSNIELLHCSYPEPVMREVYQLSCQLKNCKKFREAEATLERRRKEEKEMQPRKAGKRSLSDEVPAKSFKFIKFCSSQDATNQSNSSTEHNKTSIDFIQCDPPTSTNDSRSSIDSEALNKNSISEEADSNVSTLRSNNNNIFFSPSCSPDFDLIQKIAAAIPKKSVTPLESLETAIEMSGLENAVRYIFVRDNTSAICCQFYVGSALIATGRDATERTAKERAVQYGVEILSNLSNLPEKTLGDVKKELENWKKATNSTQLWSEMLSSDLKSKSKILMSQLSEMEKNPVYADLHLILSIVEKLFNEKCARSNNMPAAQKIQEAAAKLKCTSQVYFFHFGEDPDTLLHLRTFHCDFIIKNIFICHSKSSSKKKAKADASEQGLILLTNFIDNCELEKQHYVQDQGQSLEINFECSKHFASNTSLNENISNSVIKGNSSSSGREYLINSKEDEFNKPLHEESTAGNYLKSPVADNLPQTHIKTSVPFDGQSSSGSKSEPKLFRINHRLLANSRNRQLIVFDSSEAYCKSCPSSILNITATRCKKNLQHITEEIPTDGSRDSPKMFRCIITMDGEQIGKGQGFTEKEAKTNAAESAVLFLQNCVYTIKVKNEIDESFVISPNHVLNAENPSSVLSESNVGCKMLKMMGWTGGGIGKTSGITEPIVANDHRFGQGLGFSNNKAQERSFKQKIEALLKDYSQSNTTSDLIFSTEFSKEERKEIHKLALKYNLTNVSRGKGQQRQLFIGQKFTPMELLEQLIQAGGSTPKYELEERISISQVGRWQSKGSLLFR